MCFSKEIVATNDWQKVEEGDSIPKGLHVKMNFETGEKWVKLLDDEENNDASTSLIYTADVSVLSPESTKEGVKITHLGSKHISADASARIQEQFIKESQRKKNLIESISKLNDFTSDMSIGELDYQTMYRTLLSLPDEERAAIQDFPTEPDASATSEVKGQFAATVRRIWASRQALLKQMEDEYLADATDIIQDHLNSLQKYIMNPVQGIIQVLDYQNQPNNTQSIRDSDELNIIQVLEDLEFHLTDLDNARDFYNMGGWPLLVSLLTDSIHGIEYVVQQTTSTNSSDISDDIQLSNEHIEFLKLFQRISWRIQGLAAWCIGTAVKNTEEFFPWALDNFSDLVRNNDDNLNPLTILLRKLENHSTSQSLAMLRIDPYDRWFQIKRKLELYALGSLLRGNHGAIKSFVEAGGPNVLQMLYNSIALSEMTHEQLIDRNNIAVVTKIIAIFDDLIMHATVDSLQNERDVTIEKNLIDALTTQDWCGIPLSALIIPVVKVRLNILDTITHVARLCKYDSEILDNIRLKMIDSSDGLDEESITVLENLRQVVMEF